MVVFDPRITPSEVSASRSGTDLVLTIGTAGDQITIENAFIAGSDSFDDSYVLGGILFNDPGDSGQLFWSGVDLQSLIPPDATAPVPITSVRRIDDDSVTTALSGNDANILVHADGDIVSVTGTGTGTGNQVALTGQDDRMTISRPARRFRPSAPADAMKQRATRSTAKIIPGGVISPQISPRLRANALARLKTTEGRDVIFYSEEIFLLSRLPWITVLSDERRPAPLKRISRDANRADRTVSGLPWRRTVSQKVVGSA
jgi:hypothetical protein